MRVIGAEEFFTQCPRCESSIGFFKHEVQKAINPPCIEEVYRYFIVCPVCHQNILINKEIGEK